MLVLTKNHPFVQMKNGINSVKRRDWKMATTGTAPTQVTSTPTQPQHGNATVSSITISNGTASNGTGTITISDTISNLGYYTTAGTSISNAAWSLYTNYMKPKTFKLGNTTVCIYNCDNKYFIVDNVHFSFETQGTNVTLRVGTYGTTNLSSLDEVRNYIKSMKMYYLKCKEFEKQLELSSDFA